MIYPFSLSFSFSHWVAQDRCVVEVFSFPSSSLWSLYLQGYFCMLFVSLGMEISVFVLDRQGCAVRSIIMDRPIAVETMETLPLRTDWRTGCHL